MASGSGPLADERSPDGSSPTAALLLRWFTALEGTPSGQLMLTNLLHAYRTGRLPAARLRALIMEFARTWTEASSRRPDAVVEEVADRAPDKFLCQPPSRPAGPCSRVTDDVSFVAHNIDYRELPFEFVDSVPAELLDQIEDGLPAPLLRDETETVRGRRPFAWVTQTCTLAELRQQYRDQDQLATAVRDHLGLAHYWQDHLLIEIRYPDEITVTLPISAPTFIDGGAGVLFRARTTTDGWGRAVNLDGNADGLPEAVHPPIRLTAGFKVQRLGRVLRGSGFTHAEVISGAEHPWRRIPPDLLAFLLDDEPCTPTTT